MTNLRTKIIAGVLGIALTTTVGATAVMHNQNKTEEVKAEVTTTTTTTQDDFIPVKTEPMPKRISREYEVNIECQGIEIHKVIVDNYGGIILPYERGLTNEGATPSPTTLSLIDEEGTKGNVIMQGYPQIGFEGINPLSKSFTLTIAFEDLEEQTIEIVLPDEYTQK